MSIYKDSQSVYLGMNLSQKSVNLSKNERFTGLANTQAIWNKNSQIVDASESNQSPRA